MSKSWRGAASRMLWATRPAAHSRVVSRRPFRLQGLWDGRGPWGAARTATQGSGSFPRRLAADQGERRKRRGEVLGGGPWRGWCRTWSTGLSAVFPCGERSRGGVQTGSRTGRRGVGLRETKPARVGGGPGDELLRMGKQRADKPGGSSPRGGSFALPPAPSRSHRGSVDRASFFGRGGMRAAGPLI